MAPLVKVTILFKMGKEASLLRNWLVFLHLLYTLVEKPQYLVSTSSYKLSVKSILFLMCIQFQWCLQNHVR